MSKLKMINESLRAAKTVQLQVTITAGESEPVVRTATVRKNKLNAIAGSGLSTQQLHSLAKTGVAQSTDQNGTIYDWQILSTSVNDLSPQQSLDQTETVQNLLDQ